MQFFVFLGFKFEVQFGVLAQSVTIDPRATANGAAIIRAQSTTAGTLIPNMTSSQRTLIASPPKGLLVLILTRVRFGFITALLGHNWGEELLTGHLPTEQLISALIILLIRLEVAPIPQVCCRGQELTGHYEFFHQAYWLLRI